MGIGLEEKIENWIKNHKTKWVVFLFLLGFGLGLGSNLLFGGDFRQGLIMAFSYSFLLIICEFSIHGSK